MYLVIVINLYEENNLNTFVYLRILVTNGSVLAIVLCSIFLLSLLIIFPKIFAQEKGLDVSTANVERFSRLGINDTFSLSGSIISTVKATNSNVENTNNFSADNSNGNPDSSSKLFEGSEPINNSIISDQIAGHNLEYIPNSESSSNSGDAEKINQTDLFSDNLVSMLSGIIIQSIEKGNPTITDSSLNNNSLQLNNPLMIVSGNWRMNVFHSNVTSFDARLVMITADGSGFHWHVLDNFHNTNGSFFGDDENIFLEGSVDFYTDNKEIAKKTNMNLFINNLEAIQIILSDKNVSGHFYGYPIYGTIDKVEIPN